MFLLPFANEIANALTITETLKNTPFQRLYKPCSSNLEKIIESSVIDSIALFGIIWNVSYMGSKHGTKMGCIYGIIVLLLSFVIPNALMERVVNSFQYYDSKYLKHIIAFGFILLLLIIEIYSSKYLLKMKWKYMPSVSGGGRRLTNR